MWVLRIQPWANGVIYEIIQAQGIIKIFRRQWNQTTYGN
jgi:hypothetical protein